MGLEYSTGLISIFSLYSQATWGTINYNQEDAI